MIFRMLVKKHQFMSSSHEGISVHMMKLWSTEEATEVYGRGLLVFIEFAPDRRRDFQRTGMRYTLGLDGISGLYFAVF